MYERPERYKNPLKRSSCKAEKATVSVMFGKRWFVLVLGPVGPQGPLGRRIMMSLFSTANQGQEFDLHMNNIQKNHSVKLSVMLLHRYGAIVWYAFGVAWLNSRGLGLL